MIQWGVILALLGFIPMIAFAQSAQQDLLTALRSVATFISIIVVGLAVPNGAYGFLQYMTAGSNVEQDERGRKRIRNTFIALGGVGLLNIAIEAFVAILDIDEVDPTGTGNQTSSLSAGELTNNLPAVQESVGPTVTDAATNAAFVGIDVSMNTLASLGAVPV